MNDERSPLRPEARPVAFKDLDTLQQCGFRKTVALLEAGVSEAGVSEAGKGPRVHPRGPFLEQERSSRTVLISGGRGTGKTTLLLSLADALTPDSESGPRDRSEPAFPLPTEAKLMSSVQSLRRRLIWLETLDMEPLPESANLLGAVLARVEAAVGKWLPEPTDNQPVGLLSLNPTYDDANRDLAQLQTAVALSFAGNVKDRAGHLDPDTFAFEVRRGERERLQLNEEFAAVLSRLSREVAALPGLHAPVFVLPVDDIDLNPSAAPLLLELLRAVQSPHLFLLLVADDRLLELIMRLRYRGALARLAGPSTPRPDELLEADVLARSAMRKHLPGHQRVLLEKVARGEVKNFCPLGHDVQPLGAVLSEIRFGEDAVSLADGPTGNVTTLVVPLNELPETDQWYSWPLLFDLTVRELVDLHMAAGSATSAGPDGPSPVVRDLAAERLQALVSGRTSPSHYTVSGGYLEWRTEESGDYLLGIGSGLVWTVSDAALDRSQALLFAGGTDFLDKRTRPSRDDVSVPPPDLRWTATRQTPEADPDGGEPGPGSWTWPMPRHSRVWGYERAAQLLAELDSRWTDQPDRWHGSWIATMTTILEEALRGGEVRARPSAYPAATWQALAARLGALQGKGPLAERWLIGVGALCTPEMGMTAPRALPDDLWAGSIGPKVEAERQRRIGSLPPLLQTRAEQFRRTPGPTRRRAPGRTPARRPNGTSEPRPGP